MTVTEEILSEQLAQLVRQMQAGNDILLTQDNKPVARLVPLLGKETAPGTPLKIRSFTGHKVLFSSISQAELAEEMFAPK